MAKTRTVSIALIVSLLCFVSRLCFALCRALSSPERLIPFLTIVVTCS